MNQMNEHSFVVNKQENERACEHACGGCGGGRGRNEMRKFNDSMQVNLKIGKGKRNEM